MALAPQNARERLPFTVGAKTGQYLLGTNVTGATPVLQDEDGRILHIRRKEVESMWNEPTSEELARIPRLYETEEVPLKEKQVWLHFFIGACDWFIAEFDGEDLFWGYAILNGNLQGAEWGYFSFNELKRIKITPGFEIDCDRYWQTRKAIDIEKIRIGNHWQEEEELNDNC